MTGCWFVACLAGVAAAGTPAEEPTVPWVDAIGWAADDRTVARSVRDRESPLYAVEAKLTDVGTGDHRQRILEVREAVRWTNPTRHSVGELRFTVPLNALVSGVEGVWVSGAWVDNRPAPVRLDGEVLVVRLPAPLGPGRSVRVLLVLAERIPSFTPRGARVAAADAEGWFGEARGAVNLGSFVPTIRDDRPATFQVTLTVPAAFEIGATGRETGRTQRGAERSVSFEATNARGFHAALVPGGQGEVLDVGGGPNVRVLATNPRDGQRLVGLVTPILDVYIDHFGLPAIEHLDVVEAPLLGRPALALSGLVLVDLDHPGASVFTESALATELAQVWWGEDVGMDGETEPWIGSGLVSFSTGLYWEHAHGPDAARDRFEYEVVDRWLALEQIGHAAIPAGGQHHRYMPDQLAVIVPGASTGFLAAVRDAAGDEAFFASLRLLHRDLAGRTLDGETFLRALARAASRKTVDELAVHWLVEVRAAADLR